ncbi:MAG: hypothetical protein HY791_10000 [Deltaproteobacteria bacterium]|nr:hypothetical protein [Deltaproteobacteria bacterium]
MAPGILGRWTSTLPLGEGPALYRGMGSIGLTGASRCELLVARDPRDPKARVVKQLKSNAGPDDLPAKRFRLVPVGDVTQVEWLEDGTYSAAELLAEPDPSESSATEDAIEWLRAELEDAPNRARMAKHIFKAGRENGFQERALRRALEKLGGTKRKLGLGGWEWSLPLSPSGSSASSAGSPI